VISSFDCEIMKEHIVPLKGTIKMKVGKPFSPVNSVLNTIKKLFIRDNKN
jgi:hypothetical protein